ncbi:MAG: phosphoribosylformylglycinamidine synthase, partial [Clostridia bacterium]
MMVYRVFVEKKVGLQNESKALLNDIVNLLQIKELKDLRIVNRYDVENIDAELFESAKCGIFAEPQLDDTSSELDLKGGSIVFGVEPLPGQFDQRANSAAECIQIVSQKEKCTVKTAKIYILYGNLNSVQIETIKNYVINPVEAREASMEKPETLAVNYHIPTTVETLVGFNALDGAELSKFVKKFGLAMDDSDIAFCQNYFKNENREPTITEIRMIDTYWSDHCRHTTFLTTIDSVKFESPLFERAYQDYLEARKNLKREHKPINLMDLATIGAKVLKSQGKLDKLDESEEINACTVKIKVTVDGKEEDWLLLFKNETHNHPTEIEPFGGAATCIGGAIR